MPSLQQSVEEFEKAIWVNKLANWNAFFTGTFRGEYSVESARKSFEKTMAKWLPGRNYFYAIEAHPCRGSAHVHAVIEMSKLDRRKDFWGKWFERYGRNRLEPIKSSLDTAAYCAKYIGKAPLWWNTKIHGEQENEAHTLFDTTAAPAPAVASGEGRAPEAATRAREHGCVNDAVARKLGLI